MICTVTEMLGVDAVNPENPYQPPQETSTKGWGSSSNIWLGVPGILALALLTGGALYLMPTGWQPSAWMQLYGVILSIVFWCSPVLALVLSTSIGLGTKSTRSFLGALIESIRGLFISLLILVAGYLTFGATCCCTNSAIGIRGGANPLELKPSVVALVTVPSVLLGCGVVYMLQRRQRGKGIFD